MRKYYYNTTKGNSSNKTLGYLTVHGDFIPLLGSVDLFAQYDRPQLVLQIIVAAGLLSAGETYDEFCQRVAREAAMENKELFA
jgi:hypothetical protein